MPVQAFLDEFLPFTIRDRGEDHPDPQDAFTAVTAGVKHEVDMYDPFIEAMGHFAPGIKFFNTHSSPDTEADKLAPDICGYVDDNLPDEPETDFSKMSIFVEFKFKSAEDPFADQERNKQFRFERDTEQHMKRRGQIGSYSAALSGSQFRVHVFSVSICENNARFIRRDRSGAVVSRSFNYLTDPKFLSDFFWRYPHLDRQRQGYDITISTPLPEETMVASEAFLAEKELECNDFRKIMVPDLNDPTVEKPFIIPFPLKYECRSPFSRATRPMLAFDLCTKLIVFLKDYWRPDVDGIDKEGYIYTVLHNHNIPNIAPFGTGNDLLNNVTRTQEFANANWACHRSTGEEEIAMMRLCQYRMTSLVIGKALTEFSSSKEFVGAIADAMKAHDGAYFQAKILHRDISVGNIIIFETRGLLIDWDRCIKVDDPLQDRAARCPTRTGTWQFMSAMLLLEPAHYHVLEDDRESALYVLFWTALRYTEHSDLVDSMGTTAASLMMAFDEAYADKSGHIKRGGLKSGFLTGNSKLRFDGRPLALKYKDRLEKLKAEN